ncbi:energy transducer TonB [Maricaulis sp. CAU 1757]
MTVPSSMLRLPVILPVAGLVTLALFMLMRQLIDIGDVTPETRVERPRIEIQFAPADREIIREPVQPVIDPTPPPPSEFVRSVSPQPGTGGAEFAATAVPVPTGPSGFQPAAVAHEPIPRIRVGPSYPLRALERGLEGQCTIIFDILPDGTTTNIRPLSCTSTLFERSSMNAVADWRYDPQIRDGRPVMYRGATTQLRYALEE